ncbi:hypothetical protein B0H13DRAFT_2285627 [Mycena leptocephala]|nr:hypothetical protein B0H13DRAFT_2285627 [Mycena leptocephala]
MKISNLLSFPLYAEVTITYTVEAGDPKEFFFEVVDNTRWIDWKDKQVFSVSGSFITVPGDIGPHHIEAYNSTDVIGVNQPFAAGPTYTVLPLPSSADTTSTPTSPIAVPPTPPSTVKTTVTTQITPTQSNPTPETFLITSSNPLSTQEMNITAPSSAAPPPATTVYQSVSAGIITAPKTLSMYPQLPVQPPLVSLSRSLKDPPIPMP